MLMRIYESDLTNLRKMLGKRVSTILQRNDEKSKPRKYSLMLFMKLNQDNVN